MNQPSFLGEFQRRCGPRETVSRATLGTRAIGSPPLLYMYKTLYSWASGGVIVVIIVEKYYIILCAPFGVTQYVWCASVFHLVHKTITVRANVNLAYKQFQEFIFNDLKIRCEPAAGTPPRTSLGKLERSPVAKPGFQNRIVGGDSTSCLRAPEMKLRHLFASVI